MLQGGHLHGDVTAEKIAEHTANYAGAEIAGVCRAAASYAFDRNIKVNKGELKVRRRDAASCLEEEREKEEAQGKMCRNAAATKAHARTHTHTHTHTRERESTGR